MNPIAQLLMGHMAGPTPPMVAHMPASGPTPPSAPMPGASTGSDRQVAMDASHQLLQATAQAHDPALKASFATALAALHKWLAADDKEHHQALAGKLSPRLMAQAHGQAG